MNEKILNILNDYDVTLVPIKNTETPVIEIPVYIINLNTNNYRRSYIKYIAKKIRINYTLVIVKKITDELKHKLSKTMYNGVVGCYLSHMWCIKNAIEKNYQHFIILEDDIVFSKKFELMFRQLNYKDYDMIQMGCCDFNFHRNIKISPLQNNMYYPKYLALGAYGNIYNINFAKIIFKEKLNHCEEFDSTFNMYYEKYKMGICYPNIISTELSSTNLQHDFSFFNIKNKNSYFITKCFENFDYSNYYFIWIIFIEYCYKYYTQEYNKPFTKMIYNKLIDDFASKQDNDKRKCIINVLKNNGIFVEDINEILDIIHNDKYL